MLSHVAYMPKVAKQKPFSKETEASFARSQRNVQDQTRPIVVGGGPPMQGGGVPVPTTGPKEAAEEAVLEKAAQIVTKRYQSNMAALEKAASL